MSTQKSHSKGVPELEHMVTLCSSLGSPQDELCFIHVAGTNGKGSVCRFVYELLRAQGYRVGIFTSPHLRDIRERFEVDDALISAERFGALEQRVYEAIAALESVSFTEFEVLTALGFLYFAEQKPDFVVLEAGLGGRLDATNIIKAPLVAVITQIGLDHTGRLGNSIEQIAREKAGIIKEGCSVVTGATGAALEIIEAVSSAEHAPLIQSSVIEYHLTQSSLAGCSFDATVAGRHYTGAELSMVGEHQVANALAALSVLDLLHKQNVLQLNTELVYRGLRNTHLDARFQVVPGNPPLIIDGAHNPDGARSLVETLEACFHEKRLLFVCSFQRDKEVQDILQILAQSATAFIATGSSYERTLDASELGAMLRACGCVVIHEAASSQEAFERAAERASDYDAVVFTGSLYFAGAIIQCLIAPDCP